MLLQILITALAFGLTAGAWNGKQSTLVPAYFYPGSKWDQMIHDGAGMIIANPDSGPGTDYDDIYDLYIAKARDAGIDVVGYVYTKYGKRDQSLVEADILKYKEYYWINGIFFDEVAADTQNKNYYKNLANFVRSLDASYKVVLNPGTVPEDEAFMDFSDVVVVHETFVSEGLSFKVPSWICDYDANKVALIYHTSSEAQMKQVVQRGKKNLNTGYMFVTDDVMSNPYDKLPTYYAQEVASLKATTTEFKCGSF